MNTCNLMKSLITTKRGRLLVVVGGLVLLSMSAIANVDAEDPVPTVPAPPAPTAPAMLTPPSPVAMSSSFESVEKEKVRLVEEQTKMENQEVEFQEGFLKLQKKLLAASLTAATPESLSTDYSSFINASAKNVDQTTAYYNQLKGVLNQLSFSSPYLAGTVGNTVDPAKASQLLQQLGSFDEDEGISSTILNQWAAKEGGVRDDTARMYQLNSSIDALQKEKARLQWNYDVGAKVNPINGEQIDSSTVLGNVQEQIQDVKVQLAGLLKQRDSFGSIANASSRKLEFQQFIVQLAIQQRYLHALIACGFYRNVFTDGDVSLSASAYPGGERTDGASGNGESPRGGMTGTGADDQGNQAPQTQGNNQRSSRDAANPSSGGGQNAPSLPMISTITGLESFLLNRIRDAKFDREAIENMFRERRMSEAESLLHKMVLTAKYQPELQTISYDQRQSIQEFSETIRQMSEALNSKNWPEVDRLSAKLEKETSDVSAEDLKAFSKENRENSLSWVKTAELAMRMGDIQGAQSLLDAARKWGSLDKEVADAISNAEGNALSSQKLKEQLEVILKTQDYAQAFNRMDEFLPFVASENNPDQKRDFQNLIEQEKQVREALEKSGAYRDMNAVADAWMTLEVLSSPLRDDKRVLEKKSLLAPNCGDFISCYEQGEKFETSGKPNQAIAWYLQALSSAPTVSTLQGRIKTLGLSVLQMEKPEKLSQNELSTAKVETSNGK